MKQTVKIPPEAVKFINHILEKGNDVLIRYYDSKKEIVVYEQKETVQSRINLTNE